MIVDQKNSTQIVERIYKILNKSINIMDMNGIIVASTDTSRIGTFHKGAYDLIQRSVPELDIYSGQEAFGTKEGINAPIRVDGQTIGVIGITGNPDELRDISSIIGEMASIFFKQTVQTHRKEITNRELRMFWEDILFQDHIEVRESEIKRGKDLNIRIDKIKCIAVVHHARPENGEDDAHSYRRLISCLQTSIPPTTFMYHHYVADRIVFMFTQNIDAEFLQILNDAIHKTEEKTNTKFYCGISDGCKSYINLSTIFQQADKALTVAIGSNKSDVCQFNSLILEIILNQIPMKARLNYLEHVFANIPTNEYEDYLTFLRTFYECNGSIQRISETLYIHKNTVQYRIKKIFEVTGYDPRNYSDSTILNLCVRLSELV